MGLFNWTAIDNTALAFGLPELIDRRRNTSLSADVYAINALPLIQRIAL